MRSNNSPVSAASKSKGLVIVAMGSSESVCPLLLDAVYEDASEELRGYYSGKTVAEFEQSYEGSGSVQLMHLSEFNKLHDDALRTEPVEITEQEYLDAQAVLPPMKWHRLNGVESFRQTEFYSGTMTSIYAQCDGRYWTFRDDAYMDTADLVAKVRKAMLSQSAREPYASMCNSD